MRPGDGCPCVAGYFSGSQHGGVSYRPVRKRRTARTNGCPTLQASIAGCLLLSDLARLGRSALSTRLCARATTTNSTRQTVSSRGGGCGSLHRDGADRGARERVDLRFVVEESAPGSHLVPRKKIGLDAQATRQVSLTTCAFRGEHAGAEGNRLKMPCRALDGGKAELLPPARWAEPYRIGQGSAYLKEVRALGRPLAEFSGTAVSPADMHRTRSSADIFFGRPPRRWRPKRPTPPCLREWLTFVTDAGFSVANEALQLLAATAI